MATAPAQPPFDAAAPQPEDDARAATTPGHDSPSPEAATGRRPLGPCMLRVAAWLFVGIILTIATSWGCVLWRVYVTSAWLPITGMSVPPTAWPFGVGEPWPPPQQTEIADGFGYHRERHGAVHYRDENGRWLDEESFNRELSARVDRDLPDGNSLETIVELPPSAVEFIQRQRAITRAFARRDLKVQTAHTCVAFQRRSGFPFLAMESRFASQTSHANNQTTFLVGEDFSAPSSPQSSWQNTFDRGIPWPSNWATAVGTIFTLPLRPVWPAFIANSVLWALALWGLSRWTTIRRERRRLKVGQCPRCRYQVNDLPLCPECGLPNTSPLLKPEPT